MVTQWGASVYINLLLSYSAESTATPTHVQYCQLYEFPHLGPSPNLGRLPTSSINYDSNPSSEEIFS